MIKLRLSRRPRKMNWSAAPLTSNYEPDTVVADYVRYTITTVSSVAMTLGKPRCD